MVDLHTHSNISDGILNPIDLISYAVEENLSAIALTDHDSTDGINAAAKQAEIKGIDFIPGVELTVSWPTGEFHLLGLGIKRVSARLAEITEILQKNRIERNRQIILKMKENGFDVSYEELEASVETKCIGRPHFAEYLVKKKLVKNRQDAFNKYIAKGRPYYVEKTGCNLDEAITAIVESGAVPVLAHPLSLYVSWGKMQNVLEELKERGIVGIEAFHPGARLNDCLRLEELGKKLGFCITAGSDYHGEAVRSDRHLGYTAGNRKIEDRFYYEELKPLIDKAVLM
ncbi:MAG: PHP domain-containing protein [Spirochaetaceae bacterium]|nr:PHP domain-containing protein [Spirochaetaceae bacterium]